MKTNICILSSIFILFCLNIGYTQPNNTVTIEGKQFKLNGANFYPMVMNYGMEITKQSGNGWMQSHITPYVEYGVNSGPAGSTYSYECTDQTLCLSSIQDDWTYLQSIGFNTIRVAGFYPRYDEVYNTFYFNCRAAYNINFFYKIPVNPFNASDPGLIFILDQYESLMQVANTAGVKLIFNMIGKDSHFLSLPGANNDEIEHYNAFLDRLSQRVASLNNLSHTVLAYDIWNEPCYHDLSNDKTKQEACEIIEMWYNTVKSHGPTPLVTLGTCGSGDVLYYDPAVIKVDFHSLHVYPHWQPFEDKTDPAMQQRALSRIYDELYWFNKASPVPWIMGETGFTASANLSVQPVSGTNGTLQGQANFAQAVMDATCNCGGSGFSWWWFQDGYWNTTEPGSNHYGMLERGYLTPSSSGGGLPEKLVANVFDNYIPPASVSSCGPCPVTAAALQTYDPALTYFNPFQHPSNPQNTIKGYIYDQDGNPIANAYVGGHTLTFFDPQSNYELNPYHKVFTDGSGYFEIIPSKYVPPFQQNTQFYGSLHSLFLSTSGGERLKYSARWLSSNCNSVMPLPIITHSWPIKRINYAYNGEFTNIYVLNGENRDVEATNKLTIENSIIYSGASANIRAKNEVGLKSGFHSKNGSLTHIYCEETSITCTNYSNYTMQFRVPEKPISVETESQRIIELQFNKQENISSFFVSPNPANSFFKLHSESNEPVEINMLNMLGELITSVRFKNTSEPVDVTHLSKGVYILMDLNTGEVKKLILQ